MKPVPLVKAKDVVRALERAGFVVGRVEGRHHRLVRQDDPRRATTVPVNAARDLPRGTLRDIIEQAGLTTDGYIELLGSGSGFALTSCLDGPSVRAHLSATTGH
jgi:predicted RNA binding protein YcfA (HicA-like mRNA interferase family)